MKITEYASLSTEELIQYAQLRNGASPLEIELAQRLTLAVDMIADGQVQGAEARTPEVEIDGADTGR
jgi:hypothetical protein